MGSDSCSTRSYVDPLWNAKGSECEWAVLNTRRSAPPVRLDTWFLARTRWQPGRTVFRTIPAKSQGNDAGGCVSFLLPGSVYHGHDARAERFRQRRPGVEDALQVGVNLGAAPTAVYGKGVVARCEWIVGCGIVAQTLNQRVVGSSPTGGNDLGRFTRIDLPKTYHGFEFRLPYVIVGKSIFTSAPSFHRRQPVSRSGPVRSPRRRTLCSERTARTRQDAVGGAAHAPPCGQSPASGRAPTHAAHQSVPPSLDVHVSRTRSARQGHRPRLGPYAL